VSQTQSPSQTPIGGNIWDGTAGQSYAVLNALVNASTLSTSTWGAIAFAMNETDLTCGPGQYSLTQLTLALSQVSTATLNVQLQLYTANVSELAIRRMTRPPRNSIHLGCSPRPAPRLWASQQHRFFR